MKLYEHEGKKLFEKYGISVPKGGLFYDTKKEIVFPPPHVVKAQTYFGDRKKYGGIFFTDTISDSKRSAGRLLGNTIQGERISSVLIEERISAGKEYYVAISYDTDSRAPVLSLSPRGGSGVLRARTVPIDMMLGMPNFFMRSSVLLAGFPREDAVTLMPVIEKLWKLFISEHAVLAEINPLFKTSGGQFIAGDAKIILDDEKLKPTERRFLDLGGDIAILASGGGASLVNIDALMHFGGKPANYTEYSGNPPASVVRDLTVRVLSQKNLKGCWVVGGTANFTDIFETLSGFIEGLRLLPERPRYPIVIRRDGPRKEDAFVMLKDVAEKEGYDFHLFGREVPMAQSARVIVKLAYKK